MKKFLQMVKACGAAVKKFIMRCGAFLNKWSEGCSKTMEKPVAFMNRFSLLFHALMAAGIYFIMETMSRHSALEAWNFMIGSPKVYAYNTFMIFMTFMIVYLFRRRIFVRLLITAFWIYLGYMNGTILNSRVTPFTGQDLHLITDALDVVPTF